MDLENIHSEWNRTKRSDYLKPVQIGKSRPFYENVNRRLCKVIVIRKGIEKLKSVSEHSNEYTVQPHQY